MVVMRDIFRQCQNGMQCHGKLLKELQKIYDKTDIEKFWSEFKLLMMYSMIIQQRAPSVERTIDFIAKFVTITTPSIPEVEDQNDSTMDDVTNNKLLQKMLDFLLENHSANDKAVRFRISQLIHKILDNLGEDARIDDDLYDKIYECMLERLRDKIPIVRMHAVLALTRLQNPRDENCPVIKAYLFLMNCDPNPDIRRIVLSNIAPSVKTLPAILTRRRDVRDVVRKTAYTVMGEKIHIKALSIANRVALLHDGLTDRSESVKAACSGKLLQTWLRTFGGNVLELLGSLDVENSTETCELVLKTLLKEAPLPEVVQKFDILDDKILIGQDKLTSENAMYWQAVCKHIHSLGVDGDEFLDKVLPNCLEFCQYIRQYVDTLKESTDIDTQMEREFIIQQLLSMIQYMELADQSSRKAVENLLHELLIMDHVSHSLVKYIIEPLSKIKSQSSSLVPILAEVISEIREPITTVERGPSEDHRRQNDIKIANIRVKLNELKESLDESVRSQDFGRAAEIKQSISELETERNQLLDLPQTQTEEIRTERTDVATILKCHAIVAEMLETLSLSSVSPSLQMLIESLILPGIQNEDGRIRNLAVKALGLCCVISKDLVMQYLPLFMQASQIDVELVRCTALRVIFDMLHLHGLEVMQRGRQDDETSSTSTADSLLERQDSVEDGSSGAAAAKLVAILCAFLDKESSELRTVAGEGLAKLLLSGRVVSSKILSHLILIWYNPTTEDDTHLRHCLGTFFPIYAFAGRANQDVVEEAFIPTLKTLRNAPLSSPLAEVNAENVAELLIQLTNSKLLLKSQNETETIKENPRHDSLAIKICNEILSNPDSYNLKLWVKILNKLELSETNDEAFKVLAVLADQMLEVVKEKMSLKTLKKFAELVKERVPVLASEGDQDNSQNMEGGTAEETTPPNAEMDKTAVSDKTQDRSQMNDTALHLDGSLFHETSTLRRVPSKSGGVSPKVGNPTLDPDVAKSPIAALFSKTFDFKTPDRTKNFKAKGPLNLSEKNTGNIEETKESGPDTDSQEETREAGPDTDREEDKSPDSRGKKRGRKSPEPSSPQSKGTPGKKSKKTEKNSKNYKKPEKEAKSKSGSSDGKSENKEKKNTSPSIKTGHKKSVVPPKAVNAHKSKKLSPVVVLTRTDQDTLSTNKNEASLTKEKNSGNKKSPRNKGMLESPEKVKAKKSEKIKSNDETRAKKSEVSKSPKSPSLNKNKKLTSPQASEEEEEVPLKTRRTPRIRRSQSMTTSKTEDKTPDGKLSKNKGVKHNSASKESLNESPKKLLRTPKHTDVKSPMRGRKSVQSTPADVEPSPQKKTKLADSVSKSRKSVQGIEKNKGKESPTRTVPREVSSPVTRSGRKVPVETKGKTSPGTQNKTNPASASAKSKKTASLVSSPGKRTRLGASLSESEMESPRTRSRITSPESNVSTPSESVRKSSRKGPAASKPLSARSPRLKNVETKENMSPNKGSSQRAQKDTNQHRNVSSPQSSGNKSKSSPAQPTRSKKIASESDNDSQSSPTTRSRVRGNKTAVSGHESINKDKGNKVLSESLNLSPRHVTRASITTADSSKKTSRKNPAKSSPEADESPVPTTRSKKPPVPATTKLKQSRSTAVRVSARKAWNEDSSSGRKTAGQKPEKRMTRGSQK
ncbi:condensin complex subunit 3-like [Saccostrea cucullata]|uniref:condensin complex subunit 3-like n=1 Tax=Saccostrea cuccullata TaxID=36930 RepID=UPI002ED2318E